jgi:CRP-like cAMP-binding protein
VTDSVGGAERRKILRQAARRRFGRYEVALHEGDPKALHIVNDRMFLASSSSRLGEPIAVSVCHAGDSLSELTLQSANSHRTATVVPLHGGSTRAPGRLHLATLRSHHPPGDWVLVSVLVERNWRPSDHPIEPLVTPADQRVCRRLLAFTDLTSPAANDRLRLRRAEPALLAGTTRSTGNRVLRRAEAGDAVKLARGRICETDEEPLRAPLG